MLMLLCGFQRFAALNRMKNTSTLGRLQEENSQNQDQQQWPQFEMSQFMDGALIEFYPRDWSFPYFGYTLPQTKIAP